MKNDENSSGEAGLKTTKNRKSGVASSRAKVRKGKQGRGGHSAESSDSSRFLVVAVGASAGGLEALTKFLEAVPADCPLALIFIQHLDPAKPSMMAKLLQPHTEVRVIEIEDGMKLERGRVHVAPPGAYLSVRGTILRLSRVSASDGIHLPIDFLLNSLASEYGERAACVILSGAGSDGSEGLKAINARGGLVIAENPEEAAFDGMPRNAIATGYVHLVAPIVNIPDALIRYSKHPYVTKTAGNDLVTEADERSLAAIVSC